MRFSTLLVLSAATTSLAFDFGYDNLYAQLVPRQDTTSRTANTQTSVPTAIGTVVTTATTSDTRSANTNVSGPTTNAGSAASTETTSATRSANTNVSGPTTLTGTSTTASKSSTAMAALAPAMRTNDVRLPAAAVGLAAVALGMGML